MSFSKADIDARVESMRIEARDEHERNVQSEKVPEHDVTSSVFFLLFRKVAELQLKVERIEDGNG